MSLDWRKFSDEQWLRVGEGSSAREADRRRFAALSDGRVRAHIALSIAAPLLMCAAYLALSGRPDVQARPATQSVREGDAMNWMAISGATAALAISTMGSAQNLLTNGGLEGSAGACTQFFVSSGSASIPGWVVSGNWNVDWVRNEGTQCVCPAEGRYYVDLNGSPNTVSGSAIRQTVATVVGKRYELRLLAFANPYNTPIGTVKVLRVTTGTVVTDIPLVTESIDFLPCDLWPWATQVVAFEASGAETVIELRSTFPNNSGGILIDAVSLRLAPCLGDLDASGTVTGVDLAIVLQNWGLPSPKYPGADIDGDGLVGGTDLSMVLSNWGTCP